MYKIIEKKRLVPNIYLLKIQAPDIAAKIAPGQFVIIRVDEKGERIPFTVADWDTAEGTVSVIFMEVGTSTSKLAKLKENDYVLNFVGPLGKPTEIDNFGTVVCIGGCYGIGAIFPIVRALKEKGNKVISIIEARSKYLLYWIEKLNNVASQLFFVTRDGSLGFCGHISQFLDKFIKENGKIDRIIVIGCTLMMKTCSDITREAGIKTIVALDPIMVDGTGMCGACRVEIGGETKFACVDGPEFDAHQVNWELLFMRRAIYLKEEIQSIQKFECEFYP